jgi:hypothetical protein
MDPDLAGPETCGSGSAKQAFYTLDLKSYIFLCSANIVGEFLY